MPSWAEQAIFWHVYPLGFLGAERAAVPTVTHRLGGLVPWLDHAAAMGADGLQLGPIFAAETHGYDTLDHFRVDPRLGDDGDFDALVSAAHERGLRVLLDGVFNHVGQGFPRFQQALREGPGSPAARWFRLRWPAGGGAPAHDDFEGHRSLVALDHAEPAVAEHVAAVMAHWLDRGADGWRLDAAYAVPPEFWARVLPRVRRGRPEAYVVGEVIHGDYAAFVAETGMDAVTQYELWKAIWSSLNDRNAFELAWALKRHTAFAESFAPMTFVGNHDVTRLASRLADERHLPHALAVLMTVAGTPSLYAGDEYALRGVKEEREGGDDAVRPAFPASPREMPPGGLPVLGLHRRLIAVRRRHPWLSRAHTTDLVLSNQLYAYESRCDGRALAVALSTADEPSQVTLPFPGSLAAGDGHLDDSLLTLPPHGWAVVEP
ncbi:alpha-amylase family protein [Nonomuraea sp. NPDC052265]|uniref:alpha-amylase family protein n=1 Tax=Nonomuraea sp. NPDC052265 TaxID=3364374 RepID=UPI0037C7DDAA